MRAGPGGCRLHLETSRDIPLVWLRVTARGGSASDAEGADGASRHMLLLARRGAGGRTRRELDQALDDLGASLDVVATRDAVTLSGLCLTRNLDRFVDLVADVLARPELSPEEHARTVAETRAEIDDLRDDDASLAARFFFRECVPGHPYSRTVMGTEESLARLELEPLRAAYERTVVPSNLVIGFAGDIDDTRTGALATRLTEALPNRDAPTPPELRGAPPPQGRRLLLVDKPSRNQSQVLIGHAAPRYGSEEFFHLVPVETAFGGMFTSRLMQEIRVQRGWSYGAGCTLDRGRGPKWFRIHLAPAAEVTPDAVALAMSLFEDLASSGITTDELEFATSYTAGNMQFRRATAHQRMAMAVADEVRGLAEGYTAGLPERLQAISLEHTREAVSASLHPEHAFTVVVATADVLAQKLERLGLGPLQVVPFDSY